MLTMAPTIRQTSGRLRASKPLTPASEEPTPTDGRRARGLLTRNAIVAEAVQLASTDGLGGLSMATLAGRLGIPKSSVHAAFGSKQDLQLAVLNETREILINLVVAPSLRELEGDPRLIAVGESWFGYLEGGAFQGGCVLSAAASEIDAQPGPAREMLVDIMREWLRFLTSNVKAAVRSGEFSAATDAEQLAFQLHSIGLAANWHRQLFGGTVGLKRARATWAKTLVSARIGPESR